MEQRYSSMRTSLNQVCRIYTTYDFKANSFIYDYGGGRYDAGINYMKKKNGSRVFIYDKYNRTSEYNMRSRTAAEIASVSNALDYIVCANVLNVIEEDEIINDILVDILLLITDDTTVLFCMYEGDKSGEGKCTTRGYQRNQPTAYYIPLLEKYFAVERCAADHNILICKRKEKNIKEQQTNEV